MTTHNSQKRQKSMHPAGFETAIPASERLETYALVRAVAGSDCYFITNFKNFVTEPNVKRQLGLYSEGIRLQYQTGY
jgi:hypothetical protein